jgi:DNA-binding transcriptional LysR family regulator
MDWLDIYSFVTVAREQSISKASRLLHLTQPTLSTRLKKLEAEFNVPFFERNPQGVQLTLYGHHFLLHALKMLEEFKGMNDQLNEPTPANRFNSEKLILGVSRPLGASFISPAFQLLKETYPKLKYDVFSDVTSYILELISIGKIHLGIVPYFKQLPSLIPIPIFQGEVVLLAPKNDTLITELNENQWRSFLLSRPFYLYSHPLPLRKFVDLTLYKLLGRIPDDIHEVNDSYTLLNLISNGLGYTLLPTSYIFDTFQLIKRNKLTSKPYPTVFTHESIPYNIIFNLPSIPYRTMYLVFSDNCKTEIPVRKLAEDISSYYSKENYTYNTF